MLEHIDVGSRIARAREQAERLRDDMAAGRRGRDVVTDDRPPRPGGRNSVSDDTLLVA
jgi:hypothetical protein